jgi:hypothetical protein
MAVHRTFSPVPFDNRLERCETTTEDGEVLAVEYHFRSDLQQVRKPGVPPALVWALLLACAILLAFR